MVTLNGTYCTISEIAEQMGISRQRCHMIAKRKGVTGIVVARNFKLYDAHDVEIILGVDTRKDS